jgi:predicted DNA-binding protein with PD1-like motif
MNVHEARRTRHLVIRLDRGDELPAALVRALDEAEARSGFITGVGTLEAAELVHLDPASRGGAHGKTRRIEAPCDVIALSGNVAILDGATSVRLSAVLSRDGDLGLATFGGQLVWARAHSVELHMVVLEDLALTRVADERTGLPVLEARPASASALPSPVAAAAAAAAPAPAPPLASISAIPLPAPAAPPAPPAPPPPAPAPAAETNAMPQRPQKPSADLEAYPEIGDAVMHFHFGECTVIGSDGDRIKLRQDKDGRVREVALTMLRIEPPSLGADGTRHFKLHRKN